MKPVDAHCHLDFEHYSDDREEVISRAEEKLEFVVCAGTGYESNLRVKELADQHDIVISNLGLHPTSTDEFESVDKVIEQIRENNPPAIGEIGLDHYHVKDSELREEQERVFMKMLEVAEELDKPVAVHTREAEEQCVDILKDFDGEVFLHCFNGNPGLAKEAANKGMKIGVTTQVLYSNRVQDIVRALEVEDLMLETDSPFLYQGKRNEPVNVIESAEKIAELKDVDVEKVVHATTSNAEEFFL